MTQEEEKLLLKDLCARLPYGVKVHYQIDEETDIHKLHVSGDTVLKNYFDGTFILDGYKVYTSQIKPYLRPMSSMTEEEIKIYRTLQDTACSYHYEFGDIVDDFLYFDNDASLDYLNSIHIDYRGIIEKGLALETPEDMYK